MAVDQPGSGVTFEEMAAPGRGTELPSGEKSAADLEAVFDVPVRISVVLGRTRVPVASLLRMANQIAANNEGEGLDAAAAAVALHLDSFWTPTMKADLVDHASTGSGGLAPAVLAALELISVDA